jgi:hypothetical protein
MLIETLQELTSADSLIISPEVRRYLDEVIVEVEGTIKKDKEM